MVAHLNYTDTKLAVSEVADWSTRGQVKSPTAIFSTHGKTTIYLYTKPKPNPSSIDRFPNIFIEYMHINEP